MKEKNPNLKFQDITTHITREQLNEGYGHIGMEYEASKLGKRAAKTHAKKEGKHVVPLYNYHPANIVQQEDEDGKVIGTRIKDKVKPFIKGYLVS